MTRSVQLARGAWIIAATTLLVLMVRQIEHVWSESRSIGPGPEYFGGVGHFELSPRQATALERIGLSADWHAALVTVRFALVIATTVVIAGLIWRRARTWAPLFLSWFLLTSVMFSAFTEDPGSDDLPAWLGVGAIVLFAGGAVSMMGLLLVFPDDRSARWIVLPLLGFATVVVVATLASIDAVGDFLWDNGVFVGLALVAAGLTMQVRRVRRSGDRTARDLLLLTAGMLALFIGLSFGTDSWESIQGSRAGLWSVLARLAFETAYMAIPLAYGVAVLSLLARRGHWDMDVRLKGSVGYAALTTIVVLGYFGAVAITQAIVNDVSGADASTFALMVSTGSIAALILPAHAALRRGVDRIFDRRSRDATKLVATFESSVVRERRPDDLADALVDTVEQIFRPESAELWSVPEVRR